MGQEPSKPTNSSHPLNILQSTKPKTPSKPKILTITTSNKTLQITIPDETLTCGWLLCETIRFFTELDPCTSITALCSNKSESLDCWLLLYDRTLLPLKPNDTLFAVLHESVQDRISISHFTPIKVIGQGGFSNVTAVRKKDTGNLYAIKTMNKDFVVSEGKIEQIMTEKEILSRISHPFIVKLYWAFQSKTQLHLVLELCPGGELFYHLHNLGRLTEDQARFYFTEVVLALEYLHSQKIVYRDLKPENILLDIDGHIRITDFGLSKQSIGNRDRSFSICGSPEYMAPEMLIIGEHGLEVDFYTLGALLYELLTGLPPFYDRNRSKMKWKIMNQELEVPEYVSKVAKSILEGLLEKNPEKRLGFGGVEEIKSHDFCKGVNWDALISKQIKPPLRPHLRRSNFDPEYRKLRVDEEFYLDTPYGNEGFEEFEFDSDMKFEVCGQGEVSFCSKFESASGFSEDRSEVMEGSRKSRSEVLSTEYSRSRESHKSRS